MCWVEQAVTQVVSNLAIDLEANRFGDATTEDFKIVLRAINKPGKEHLIVRFGFEVFFTIYLKI